MYADKTAASCTIAGTCLAVTGMDVAQVIFVVIAGAVMILSGLTLFRWFRASPKTIETGVDD